MKVAIIGSPKVSKKQVSELIALGHKVEYLKAISDDNIKDFDLIIKDDDLNKPFIFKAPPILAEPTINEFTHKSKFHK